jgi:AraC-like DNA-binding protein
MRYMVVLSRCDRGEEALAKPLCRASFLTGLGEYVESLGGSFTRVLERAGLEEEEIINPNHFIPFEKECVVLEEAAHITGHPALMVEVSNRQTLGIFGAIGALALGSTDVRGGLVVFEKYLHYGLDAVQVQLRSEKDIAFFTLHTDFQPAVRCPQFWHHGVALMCQVVRMLCGRRWSPRSVYLDQPTPTDLTPYTDFFRAPLAFGQGWNGLAFPAEVLDWPTRDSLSAMSADLRLFLNDNYANNFQDQVRLVLNSMLATRKCTAGAVALTLGLKERTLQRKLKDEGTSFRDLQEQVRSSLAVNYMREPQFRLTDIAEMLGYADLSVFSRSFKRWFGISPQKWRAREFRGKAD